MTSSLSGQDITAIAASLARQEYAKHTPLALGFPDLPAFPQATWQEAGISPAMLSHVTAQANAMFATDVLPPETTDTCGKLCAALWDKWQQGPREITFLSSGSTGAPKGCIHTEEMLIQEARSLATTLSRRQARHALAMVPLHHVYGFMFGCLVPRCLGLPVSMIHPFPTVVADRLEKWQDGLWVVGIPLVWQKMCSLASSVPQGSGHVLFSAGSPLEDSVLDALASRDLYCTDIYGTSETGAVGWRDTSDAAFTLFPHWHRGEDSLVRRMPGGNEQAAPQMDMLCWETGDCFRPSGRLDDAVQVGGQNVYPSRVAAILKEVSGVRDCAVRLMRPDEGFRLKAFVVVAETADRQALRETLRLHAQGTLHEHERPGSYVFGHKLPQNAMGKIADW